MEFISRQAPAPHMHGLQTNQTEKRVKEAERNGKNEHDAYIE